MAVCGHSKELRQLRSFSFEIMQRKHPFATAHLVDHDLTLDLGAANGQRDRMVLVATEPLTRNEPWEPFAAGELPVFVDGEQVWQAASKRPGVRVESARGAPAFASVLAA